MVLVHRYNVEKSVALGKPGVPEFPLVIQDMVVDTPIAGDPAGVCRLKYDRKPGGGSTQLYACMIPHVVFVASRVKWSTVHPLWYHSSFDGQSSVERC
jgi:hypothetical protein